MKTILVIFGAMTSEHDLSCKSAGDILQYIDRDQFDTISVGITKEGRWFYTEADPAEIRDAQTWLSSETNRKAMIDPDFGSQTLYVFEEDGTMTSRHFDCIFARIAGNMGEDGKLQGLFETCGTPYVGCGVLGSAVSLDKDISYLFADSIGLRRPQTQVVYADEFNADPEAVLQSVVDGLVAKVGYPVFAKPCSAGSSIGISKVHCEDELRSALETALDADSKVVFEEGIAGDEIKVGMLGNENPRIGSLCKLSSNGDWNDFSTKYIAHSSTKEIPAILPAEIEDMIKQRSMDIYRAMVCSGFSRIDFFLTPENELVFNEINTMPGINVTSIYPSLFADQGIDYTQLITELIQTAFENVR